MQPGCKDFRPRHESRVAGREWVSIQAGASDPPDTLTVSGPITSKARTDCTLVTPDN
jgi:hypothetical protein